MTSVKQHSITSKQIALTVCLSSLYTISCLIPLFQIVGSKGFITLAAMLAPALGILFGPSIAFLSSLIGGFVVFFWGVLSSSSLVSGVVAAFFAGSLRQKKGFLCIPLYLALLFVFGFYPPVGPVWLFPFFIWFQIVGFLVLAWFTLRKNNPNHLVSFSIISLVSTLAGQIAGSIVFEVTNWPLLIPNLNAWREIWQGLTFIYPAERTIIAIGSTFIAIAVHKALKNTNMLPDANSQP